MMHNKRKVGVRWTHTFMETRKNSLSVGKGIWSV
jgi:hypothetical protein